MQASIMNFSFENYVAVVREAVLSEDPNIKVCQSLKAMVSNPDSIISVTPKDCEGEIHLFENETVSIWLCQFQPHMLMPPHEHLLDVHIGVYSGGEKNILFTQESDGLKHDKTIVVQSGDVISLNTDVIHAVSAAGEVPSMALHVYMGPLTKLKRGLFDWVTGDKVDFTPESFEEMKCLDSELPIRY